MNRLKLLAMSMLLAVPVISACGEDPIPPPPTGTVMGQVAIEGDGADGVTVTLSSGVTVTTANGGTFSFADVEAGTYTVTITNYPGDASFQQTSAAATIADDGETVTVNFTGAWIRTSAVMGAVTVEDEGLGGVTVRITGVSESETLTSSSGQYSFTGLRAGKYTIEITKYEEKDFDFASASSTADLAVGESKVVSFEGTYVRASAITGQVSVEGNGLQGVTVSLQGKGENLTGTTNGAGQFLFEDLRRGDYAIGITNPDPDEYGFETTSRTVAVDYGETESVPFEGIALRTAGIQGTVTVEGKALDGVTVSLQGKGENETAVTNAAGQWSFDRLHAGKYSIGITNPNDDLYGFETTSASVTVERKETETVRFDGFLLRTAAIEGEVTVKGEALSGVTVTVTGGPKDEQKTTKTDGSGAYAIDRLHAGDYSVAITGYDTDEYGFEVTTKSVSVGLRQTAEVAFDGILLRTAGVSGRVTTDGEPTSGLTVTLAGKEDRSGMTNSDGQYAFSGLAAGDYTLTLSGYDPDEYEYDATRSIKLELDEAAIANFAGRSLRTVVVTGTVSAEDDAVAGVTVTLTKMLSANAGELLSQMTTGDDGGYKFDGLLAATYRVDISGFDDELDFPATTRVGPVKTDETATWDFDAEIIRTASVSGMVTVDGDGMGDIKVMLAGDHDTDEEAETSSDGSYKFDELRKGAYTVTIVNPDDDAYDFPTTSRSVSLAVGQAQTDVSFAGSMNRRASISGQVHVEGDGIEGVTVKLRGEDREDTETDGNGEYNFPGLVGGDYTVSIENPDEDAYIFDVTSMDVDGLPDDSAAIVDFAGEHTMTASVSGVMFVDEVKPDSMYTDGEKMLPAEGAGMILQGPGLGDVRLTTVDSTGAFMFDSLRAGRYRVLLDDNDKFKAALARQGYAFRGQPQGGHVVDVPAAKDVDVNYPFAITKQTIHAGAQLATKVASGMPVGGVRMALYPTADDAKKGTNSLGVATTSSTTGAAKFEFERAKDKGPDNGPIDYLVYSKIVSVSNSDLHVHSDSITEIEYERADRISTSPAVARLINTRVNFQWWVKSNEKAKDGDQFLGGWKASNGMATNSLGKATYTGKLTAAQIASAIEGRSARFSVSLSKTQADSVDLNEKWTASGTRSHSHSGLEDPSKNTMANNDVGTIYVTWQTHALVLGVYREADDVDGYTNYQSRLPGGDHRPVSSVARRMRISAIAKDGRGRDIPYKYDHDACTSSNSGKTDPREPVFTIRDGLAKVRCLPRNDEFTIKFVVDTMSAPNRLEVGIVAERLHGYIEPYNPKDLAVNPKGSTVGTFGDGSGGVPEVRLCLSSEGTSDKECATWGYQWMSGTVMGNVGDQSGHTVDVTPTLENYADTAKSTRSGTKGAYKMGKLRDGVYNVMAHSTRTYRIRGDSVKEVVFYHDETTDDKDTATKYVGTAAKDSAKFTTQQLGLKLMGYIGHDENRDKKFRGDEVVKGITVRLTGSGVSKTTTTDEVGFYKFEDLPKGSYTIRPSSSTYVIARGYRVFGTSRTPYTYWSASAQEYYPTWDEGDVSLPYWSSYTRRSVSNATSRACNTATPPKCGTLYNFALLYKDGSVEGEVNNLSGSAADVDLIWTDVFTTREQEVTTNFRGEFTRTRLEEGDFTVSIEDAGWSVPKMRGSVPDDDGTTLAPTTVTAKVRGKGHEATMPTLHVYDAGASSDDAARSGKMYAKQNGTTRANFDSAVSWAWGKRATGTEKTATANVGTISWNSKSVRLSFSKNTKAKYELKNGFTACSGTTCTLSYNRTGSSKQGEARENTLNLLVTAPNGYDDHEYSVKVSRAAPVDNEMTNAGFLRVDVDDGDTTWVAANGDNGDGKSLHEAFILDTHGATGGSVIMRIKLTELGAAEHKNLHCGQMVGRVTTYNTGDTLKAVKDTAAVCKNEYYRLRVPEMYEIRILSEDSVSETYYVETKNRAKGGSATLKSLSVDAAAKTPFKAPVKDTVKITHTNTGADEATIAWETTDPNASVRALPSDADADADDHQLALGDRDTKTDMTIRVIAEDKKDTLYYNVDVKRANDDATLKTLTSPVEFTPDFDPTVTSYKASVTVGVEKVAFDYAANDTDASVTHNLTAGKLTLGDPGTTTTATFIVTAEDTKAKKTYSVAVTRAAGRSIQVDYDGEPFSASITEGVTDSIKVSLIAQPSVDSTVTVTVAATTGMTVEEGPLTFSRTNYSTGQKIRLIALNDDDAEPNDVVQLTFLMTGDSANGYYETAGSDSVAVVIPETDTKGFIMTATGKEISEGAQGSYSIRLNSQPTDNVTIETSGEPTGVTVTGQVVFSTDNWNVLQPVNITKAADSDTTTHSPFTLSHTVVGGGYTGESVDNVRVVVREQNVPAVVIGTTAVKVKEGTGDADGFTYNIRLTVQPDDDETVTVSLNFNTSDFTASVTSVTFTSGSWEGANVTIKAKDVSADVVKTITHTVTHSSTDSDDDEYDGTETASSLVITVLDVPE